MPSSSPSRRICPNGHVYFKSSACPVCPVCERERAPSSAFLALLAAPARRALEREGITTLEELSHYTETELLALHGFGPSSLPVLRDVLEREGMRFRGVG